jgi:hypothetical protein
MVDTVGGGKWPTTWRDDEQYHIEGQLSVTTRESREGAVQDHRSDPEGRGETAG